jgi:hypothetical protein
VDPKISQTIGWIMAEIDAIERVLRKLAPGTHIANGDVITEVHGSAQIQRSPKDPAASRAWAGLPAISRAIGPPPLVAPNRPFAAALASSEPPPPILAPLSHGHSLEAPKGIVSGIARPTSTVAGRPLPTPVQRSPLGRRRPRTADVDATSSESDAEIEPLAPTSSPQPRVMAAPNTTAVPIRKLAAATAPPPSRTLTRAAEPTRAAPVGLVGQPRASGRRPAASSMPAAPAVQRSPEPSAPNRSIRPAPSPPARTAEPIGSAPRLTIGQARRLGLGAPVVSGPVMGSTPAFRDLVATQRSPATIAPSAAGTTPIHGPELQRAPEPSTPDMPLVSGPAQATGEDVGTAPAGLRPAASITVHAEPMLPVIARPIAAPIERQAADTGAPIVSAQPLRARVQRAPLTLPMPAPASGSSAGAAAPMPATSGAPVKVHRDGEAGQLSTALDARSFTHGGEIFLPASHGPLTSGTGKALLAHELTHVTQQRRLGSSLPGEETPQGKSLEADAVAAERSPQMPLAAPSSGPGAASAAGHAMTPTPTAAAHGPSPQRAPAGGGSPAPQATGSASSSSGGGSGHTHNEQELEVLAHQLYHRIGRHLRRELLVDRERVGFALDLP